MLVFWLSGKAVSPTQILRQVLENNEFVAYMQPIVSGKEQCWVGCEVLMRWQQSVNGLIQPNKFIPMAEDSEFIVPMTRAIMQQVSATFAPYVNQLPEGFHFGFNISANHCRDLVPAGTAPQTPAPIGRTNRTATAGRCSSARLSTRHSAYPQPTGCLATCGTGCVAVRIPAPCAGASARSTTAWHRAVQVASGCPAPAG